MLSGAAIQIRTGDLILTKDVLYQLSHSSIALRNDSIIADAFLCVKHNFKKLAEILQFSFLPKRTGAKACAFGQNVLCYERKEVLV